MHRNTQPSRINGHQNSLCAAACQTAHPWGHRWEKDLQLQHKDVPFGHTQEVLSVIHLDEILEGLPRGDTFSNWYKAALCVSRGSVLLI